MDMADRSIEVFSDADELEQYEDRAKQRAAQKLASITNDIDNGSVSNSAIHVRDADLPDDLDEWTGADAPGSSLYADYASPTWELTTGATIGDQRNALLAFDADEGMEDKAAVLYGFAFPEPDDGTTCPLTQLGIETPNSDIGQLDITMIDTAEGQVLVINDPLVIGKEDRFLDAYTAEDPSGQEFVPLIKVAEPSGETISTAREAFASGTF